MADKQLIKGQTFQVCVTAQNTDLTPTQFAALTYVDVCCLQETPEFSLTANVVTDNCISGERIVGIGADETTDFEVSWFYDSGCTGQGNLRGMGVAKSKNAYAVRKVYNDGVASVTTPTTVYARVMWSGYTNNGGGVEDWQVETVNGSVVQGPVFVPPAPV